MKKLLFLLLAISFVSCATTKHPVVIKSGETHSCLVCDPLQAVYEPSSPHAPDAIITYKFDKACSEEMIEHIEPRLIKLSNNSGLTLTRCDSRRLRIADMRIGCKPGSSWSYVGVTTQRVQSKTNINIGWKEESLEVIDGVPVLTAPTVDHELGHFIGMEHEQSNSEIKFLEQETLSWCREAIGWGEADCRNNILDRPRGLNETPDPESIMLYPLPCYIMHPDSRDEWCQRYNDVFSEGDLAWIEKYYPLEQDLTLIEGLGPVGAQALYNQGIRTFRQLAMLSPTEIKILLVAEKSSYSRYNTSTWAEQAALAAEEQWELLSNLQESLIRGVRQ